MDECTATESTGVVRAHASADDEGLTPSSAPHCCRDNRDLRGARHPQRPELDPAERACRTAIGKRLAQRSGGPRHIEGHGKAQPIARLLSAAEGRPRWPAHGNCGGCLSSPCATSVQGRLVRCHATDYRAAAVLPRPATWLPEVQEASRHYTSRPPVASSLPSRILPAGFISIERCFFGCEPDVNS